MFSVALQAPIDLSLFETSLRLVEMKLGAPPATRRPATLIHATRPTSTAAQFARLALPQTATRLTPAWTLRAAAQTASTTKMAH